MKPKILHCKDLAALLLAAGVIPVNCRRAVIDIEAGKPVKLYLETYADERLLDVIAGASIKIEGAE